MCVPTMTIENQEIQTVSMQTTNEKSESNVHPHKLQHKDKLLKAKEKYMKIYENNVERENKIAAQRKIENDVTEKITSDILAFSTVQCNKIVELLHRCSDEVKRSKFYRILTTTTQPAHVITIVAVMCVSSALINDSRRIRGTTPNAHSPIAAFVYLAAFVMHLGSQIFMTFVSGLSLYFALPRHAFGDVQRVLFPRYFTINAGLSFVTLFIFVKHHPMDTWDREISIQIGGMASAFFVELLVRLYLVPQLMNLLVAKTSIERAAGVGNEIACHNPGTLKHCPHYVKIYNAFRCVHSIVAMGNILSMACTTLHLHYIASNMCVL